MTENYNHTPSKAALYQRQYVKRVTPHCKSIICIERRQVSTVPKSMQYKLYNRCNRCKTNWGKEFNNCLCCGCPLRRSGRKKTPYK